MSRRHPDRPSRARDAAASTVAGAGGVVFGPGGKVLLLRHGSGHWVFPKGHVEQGETQLQAALREVAEEAGVRARCDHPKRTWTTYYRNPRGVHRLITWYRCEAEDTSTNVTEEAFVAGLLPARGSVRAPDAPDRPRPPQARPERGGAKRVNETGGNGRSSQPRQTGPAQGEQATLGLTGPNASRSQDVSAGTGAGAQGMLGDTGEHSAEWLLENLRAIRHSGTLALADGSGTTLLLLARGQVEASFKLGPYARLDAPEQRFHLHTHEPSVTLSCRRASPPASRRSCAHCRAWPRPSG